MNSIYEPHVSINQELPFIFHQDTYEPYHTEGIGNWHENLELLYVTGGTGEIRCGNRICPVKKGDVVVVNSYEIHKVRPVDRITLYCLIIDRQFGRSNGFDTNEIKFDTCIRNPELEEKLKKVAEEYADTKVYRNAGIRSAVLELLVYLCRNHSKPKAVTEEIKGTSYECVRFAVEYIKANYDKKLTVDEIASKAGLSKYYFLREFKNITGHTVIAYVNIIRCEYAKELLSGKRHNIHEIARLCGFESDSYFSSVFKKYTGQLPSEYTGEQVWEGYGLSFENADDPAVESEKQETEKNTWSANVMRQSPECVGTAAGEKQKESKTGNVCQTGYSGCYIYK